MKLRQGRPEELHIDLQKTLSFLRKRRRFDAESVLNAKIALLREYFTRNNLDAAVVGISGGIDSAVVTAMLSKLRCEENSPLEKLILVTLPALNDGVTGQADSVSRVRELRRSVDGLLYELEVKIHPEFETQLGPWAKGQSVAYHRTAMLYSFTSQLSEKGYRPIVVGTTNRDEGAYLGYVGKAADGMVDIQPIADLHKSEVYAIAKLLDIPESIMNVEPTGDMFDGAPDVEVFGAPYDYVEFFILWKTLLSDAEKDKQIDSWSPEAYAQGCEYNHALGKLHRLNAHKYKVGWPSMFLDVMPRYCLDGWEEMVPANRTTVKPQMASVFALDSGDRSDFINNSDEWGGFGFVPIIEKFTGAINQEGLDFIRWGLPPFPENWSPADEYGRWGRSLSQIGTYRSTFEDNALAQALWWELQKKLDPFRHFVPEAGDDVDGTMVWRPVGVSPVFRVIRYMPGGKLFPHYDAPFIESEKRRTLQSIVIPIHGNGILNIHSDAQSDTSFNKRNFSDEVAQKVAGKPIMRIENQPGDILVFDHRILHSPELTGERTIIRTDVIFERS